jgi:serine/threonine protein kinase
MMNTAERSKPAKTAQSLVTTIRALGFFLNADQLAIRAAMNHQQHAHYVSRSPRGRKHALPSQLLLQQQQQQQQLMQLEFQQMQNAVNIPPPPAMSPLTPASPFTVAHMMADSIHSKVRTMLNKTRLQRKTEKIQFLQNTDLVVHGLLGAGAFSQVTCVTNLKDSKKYACKHLQPKLLANAKGFLTAATELAYEVHLLSSFQHPHIIRVHGWAANGIASFEQGQHDSFFLLLDLLEETLDQRIDKWKITPPRDLPDLQLRKIVKLQAMTQIASALEYIHSMGVIFRDLKPQNIGFLKGQVKLFDFGLSRELPALDTTQRFQMSGKVGTIRYMAPEVCLYQPYNIHCDIYSWGMVAYEILSQTRPFEGFTPELYQGLVCQQGLRPCDPEAQHHQPISQFRTPIDTELRVLLEHAWHAIPEQRMAFSNLQRQLKAMQQREQQVLLEHEIRLNQRQMHGHGAMQAVMGLSSHSSSSSSQTNHSWKAPSTHVPPPPPVPAVTPPEQQPDTSNANMMNTSNDGSISISAMMANMMNSSLDHDDNRSVHVPPPPPASPPPPPAEVIDLSSDDDVSLDDHDQIFQSLEGEYELLRDGSVVRGCNYGHHSTGRMVGIGMSAETPTMMRRKKQRHVKHRRMQHPQLYRSRSASIERWQQQQQQQQQQSLSHIPFTTTGHRSRSPVRGIRRRHSSDDFDGYMSSLQDYQDFTVGLNGSISHHKATNEEPVRRLSGDGTTLAILSASTSKIGSMTPPPLRGKSSSLLKIRQQQRQQKAAMKQHQNNVMNNSSGSAMSRQSPAPATKAGRRSAWPLTSSSAASVSTSTTAPEGSSHASLEETWAEDSNYVFEQWSSGGTGNNSSFF